ncbi:prepilin peptidase [Acuticoccus sp.]|uniref:prepilin peptidase n=1 Tax=Acuticoccus sp. TaxID=1904378 RepID=UPI003B5285E2
MTTLRATAGRLAGVGIAGAAAMLVAATPDGSLPAHGLVVAAVAALLSLIAWHDLRTLTIPDTAVALTACVALLARAVVMPVDASLLLVLAIDVAGSGGALWLVREAGYRLRGEDVLGLGDVKLAAALGLLLGALGFALALLAASVTGLLLALALAATGRPVGRTTKLPFGALLAPSALLTWLLIGRTA